jgi:hypothetical protein
VYGLFHGLCLLAYGRTVFFGPASETNQVRRLYEVYSDEDALV